MTRSELVSTQGAHRKGNNMCHHFLLSSVILLMGSGVLASCSGSIKSKSQDNRTPPANSAEPEADSDSKNDDDKNTDQRAAKLRMESGCLDPDLTKVLNTESITLCDGKQAKGLLAISSLDIRNGTKVGGVVGSLVVPNNCANEGDQSCVVTGTMTAVSTVGLADKLISTETVAGVKGNVFLPSAADTPIGVSFGVGGNVAGTRRHTRLCRNGADLSTRDAPSASNVPSGTFTIHLELWNAPGDTINPADDSLKIDPDRYDLNTGDVVKFRNDGGLVPDGLALETDYFVISGSGKIQLAASALDATNGNAIDIQTQGTGNFYVIVSKAVGSTVNDWDTIDDYNVGRSATPSQRVSGWDLTVICDETNFTKMIGVTGLTPTEVKPIADGELFTEVWRDDLTGLYFTNILYTNHNYDGAKLRTWADGAALCSGLDSGDGSGKWRLPTQKELMQLYVNGISKLGVAGSTWRKQNMWSSTSYSEKADKVWVGNLAQGVFHSESREATGGVGAFCVR